MPFQMVDFTGIFCVFPRLFGVMPVAVAR